MEEEAGMRVAFLTRLGEGMVPHRDSVVQEGDLVHVSVEWARMAEVERVLEHGPTAGEH
jgi:trk system potassium uptake protein TrkA